MDPRKPTEEYDFKFEPFYVGKGCKKQYLSHLLEARKRQITGWINTHKFNKIRNILNEGLEPIIIKYRSSLSEEEAFDLEKELIKRIGRYDLKTGPLTNKTDGGEGCNNPSDELRSRLRSFVAGKTYEEMYGEEKAKEKRKRMHKTCKERPWSERVENVEIAKQNMSKSHMKSYLITHPDGHEEIVSGLAKWSQEHMIKQTSMFAVANGQTKQHKGYKVIKLTVTKNNL
jgi:hypothetical protein